MRRAICSFGFLLFFVVSAQAADEPGWSLSVISTADACGAASDQVDLAATYVAEWAQRNLPDPSRLTKEKALAFIRDNQRTKDIVKEKGAFIYPCSRWRQMLVAFNDSKGAVMAGVAPPPQQKTNTDNKTNMRSWVNREGRCDFFLDPENGPIDRVNLALEKDGKPALVLSLSLDATSLATLGKRQGACRFYGDVTGFVQLGGEKFNSRNSGSTACDSSGDKIGSSTQFVDLIDVGGDARAANLVRTMLSSDSLAFSLTNAPKQGQKIEIPIKGLRQAIRSITVCPAAIKEVAAAAH